MAKKSGTVKKTPTFGRNIPIMSAHTPLTASQSANVEFDTVRRGGYHMGEVDTFVAMVTDTLTGHERDAAAGVSMDTQTERTVGELLAHTADSVNAQLADASARADAIVAEATTHAAHIVDVANTTSDAILSDADSRKGVLEVQIAELTSQFNAADEHVRSLAQKLRDVHDMTSAMGDEQTTGTADTPETHDSADVPDTGQGAGVIAL
jgi:DivIVA domain-containing protein